MSDQTEVMNLARERAEKRIDEAVGALHKEASRIGIEYGLPDNISGHSVNELLGRISYVPSMARDLRRALGQALAKQELERAMFGTSPEKPKQEAPPPASRQPIVPHGKDLADLSGVTVQTVKALKGAGLNTVGDVVSVPDEHLLKISGLGERSVQQLRAAIAKAAAEVKP